MLGAPSRTRPAHVMEFRPVRIEHRRPHAPKGVERLTQQMAEARNKHGHERISPIEERSGHRSPDPCR